MPRITDCEYKFNNILGDEEKRLILKLVFSGFRPKYIAKRFGLTWEFIEREYHKQYKAIGIHFDSKKTPYYDNENSYGKNTHHYTTDSLSQDEVEIFYEL